MSHTAYDRAVDMFEALVSAPKSDAHATPARLIHAAGLPTSTGYRHVAALEAESFLRRDEAGVYRPGTAAIRTGFRGFGLGRFAPLAQPILVQLRQSTQHTAFLAIAQDMDLHMGPHSLGRETRATQLQQTYSFEQIPDLSLGTVSHTSLRSFQGGIQRRLATMMMPVEITSSAIMTLGLVVGGGRTTPDSLGDALLRAFERIEAAEDSAG